MSASENMSARCGERGNAMVYLLIAIALLAALSFAVAHGGRSSVSALTDEKARLIASDVIAFADIVEKSVSQLRLRGTAVQNLRFAQGSLPVADYGTPGASAENEVFHSEGGGILYKPPTPEVTTTGTENVQFLNSNEIKGVGTDCAADGCADLIMVIPAVREQICRFINDLAGVDNPGGAPPTDTDMDESGKFQGAFGYAETIGDEAGGAVLASKMEGCFQETADSEYVYFKVLVPR